MAQNYIIIEDAPQLDYLHDFVTLPRDYGSAAYYAREDVKAICATVHGALDKLDERIHITEQLKSYKSVIIKPNLVNVFHNAGYYDAKGNADFPETTDPRVFDAVVSWFSQRHHHLIIAESSGKPFPTTASFKIAGYDRIARRYGTELVALERRPVVRYLLPKAEVMREILIPDTIDAVVRGEAYYISVPKMKTNIYTGVTLGFKNSMGTIPYFLRERNHSHAINKKLTDMLYLFKPDLVLIDGIIGGEGNTPAPVDPVDMRMIVASNHAVEADRLTTYMMGFDPAENALIQEADRRGFGSKEVEIVGTVRVTPFRPASPSMMRGTVHEKFPHVLALAGHDRRGGPKITDIHAVTPDMAFRIEQQCVGGCLSSVAMGFEAASYGPAKRKHVTTRLVLVEGSGIEVDGQRYWFDREGKPYTKEDILALKSNIMVMGKCCGEEMLSIATFPIRGCCDPAECLNAVSNSLGIVTDQLHPIRNKSLVFKAVPGLLGTILWRTHWVLHGKEVDVPRQHEDKVFSTRPVSEAEMEQDYIAWPTGKLTWRERLSRIGDMGNLMGSLTGICGMRKAHWQKHK